TPPIAIIRPGQPRIVAIGSYIPQTVLTNEDLLAEFPDIPNVDWIVQRTGIHQRPVAPANLDVVEMGTQAALRALNRAGLAPQDIHWVIVATTTPHQVIPSTACLIQGRLGAHRAAAFDIFATCSGFLYALTIAQGTLTAQPHLNILVVTAEKMRSVVDPHDMNTAILFGDAATACVVSTRPGPGFILEELSIHAEADTTGTIVLAPEPGYLFMDGSSVFRTAVLRMSEVCEQVRQNNHLEWSDIAWVVPHQANLRILQALAKRLKISEKRVFSNIETLGNTSSSSIPLCLEQMEQQKLLLHNHNLIICAVGGGITYGAGYLRYVQR
ncbi:beta-ketoacyl-ACP synthase 3, partial [Candidatus Cyanaurora vandensis]|uniref:beta-ketoacyl-ACP synthase 3 n=1 Tax=Candidatus Cyanaurora vandensis TaxID=2714958 RepID=UPI00257C1B57